MMMALPYGSPSRTQSGSVSSTCISSYSYNEVSGMLRLTFAQSGTSYAYSRVPKQVFEEFKEAGSKGRFFNTRIRGVYG